MADGQSGPTIVLIGGEVTLDSGARLDTRQPLAGDEWDFVLRSALGGSEAYWDKAKTVADVLLDQHSTQNPWAFAWVNKTFKRPTADGTFTRVRTGKYLDDADQLMDKSSLRDDHIIDLSHLSSRYRIMPYYLRFEHVTTSTDPIVFVGDFHTTYEDTGIDIVGLAPLHYVLSRWPGRILILPHTPVIERKSATTNEVAPNGGQAPRSRRLRFIRSS